MVKIISNSFNVTPVYDGQDGPQGPPGNDGKGITSADIMFCLANSQSTAPADSSFTATSFADLNIKSTDADKYVWQCTKTTYTSGNPTYSGKVCLGKVSDFASITEQYALGTASAATGTWQDNTPPSPSKGSYLWTRTKLSYTGGGVTYLPSQSGMCLGYYGKDGDPGDEGTGIASIAATFNLSKNGTSTNETTAPTDLYYNTWQSSQPAPNDTYPYVWKKEVTTYKNPTSTETKYYCIAAKGTPGKTGPMFYLCGKFPDKAPYSKDDYRCPVVYYGGEYWYLKADSATASDTPSASSSVWGKAEKFDMVFTDVLFVKDFAKLGSFVVSGDWLISTKGILGGAESQDYTKFDPAYPDSSVNTIHTVNGTTWTGYNFVPYFAVDGKEGKIYAVKGQIGGFNIGTTSLGTTTPYGQSGYTYILRDGKINIFNGDNGYDYGLSVNGGAELLGRATKKIVIRNNTGEINIDGNPLNLNTDANNGAYTNIGNAQSNVVVNAGITTFNNQVNLSEETNVTANGVMTIQGILAMNSSIQTRSFTLPANHKVGQVFFCKSLSSNQGDLVITANTGQSIMAADSRSTSTSVNIQDNSAFVVCMEINKWVLFRCS